MLHGTELSITVREGLQSDDADVRNAVAELLRRGAAEYMQAAVAQAMQAYCESMSDTIVTVSKPVLN